MPNLKVKEGNPFALFPLLVFVLLFIGTGIFTKDFSNMPLNVAILIAAAGLAAISPVRIVLYSFYPVLIGICGVVAILIGYPKFRQKDKSEKTVVNSPN